MPAENNDLKGRTVTMTTLDAERTDLITQLAAVRGAMLNATRGLTDEQAAARPTISALCLGGLVKHVTAVERNWLRFALEGPSALSFELPDGVTWADMAAGTAREIPQWAIDHQNGFQMLPGETLADIVAGYEQVAARTDEIIAEVPDLSASHPLPQAPWYEQGESYSVRRVLLHVIAETAQHAGHADIIRETLNGVRAR